MPEEFPPPTEALIASLIEVFKHQNDTAPIRVLEKANATVELTDYDNWNNGTDIYTLLLNIPLSLFAVIEPERENLEKKICRKLQSILRTPDNARLRDVSIAPILKAPDARRTLPTALDEDVTRIWGDGYFRLFLSHVSAHKANVSKLKEELESYRISGFVAHKDIEPTKEWLTEIELALNSAHALAALVTPDFSQSRWTDQEVGIAFGKGLLVIPVRLGADPYGFMGKSQGLTGSLEQVPRLASDLVAILLKNPTTMNMMHEMLTVALEQARSFASAKDASRAIVTTDGFTQEQMDRIGMACKVNGQVSGAFNVPERIATYLSRK
jgi:TIR domain-containing protein